MATFAALGVGARTCAALQRLGIVEPLPVQTGAMPALLAGRDAVIEAPTGSGKTLAFAVPLVERLGDHRAGGARALVVVPTRELASQVAGVVRDIAPHLRVALLVGGAGFGPQLRALSSSPDVVVGCPGRILDLVRRGAARLEHVQHLVLDEADVMLDQGFAPDVERIIGLVAPASSGRQTLLASATMPAWVRRMIDRHLTAPERVHIPASREVQLEHGLVEVSRADRLEVLSRILTRTEGSAIVFHRTKHGARKLARDLARRGHRSGELQGNLSQNARDRAIGDFRARHTDVLVATNVAARGLDIDHVGLVVNYELPESAEWLTHRVGRTARNGAEGRALTFLGEEDGDRWRRLRHGGAPALRAVDVRTLLESGRMHYAAPAPPAAPPQRGGRRRRSTATRAA